MKISELIEFLSKYDDKELEVVIDICEGGYLTIHPEDFTKKENKIVILI